MMRVVNIEAMLQRVREPWKPHSVGQVNECLVKVVKLDGPFIWHHHETEDEMFLVVRGTLRMQYRDEGSEREEVIRPGEFIIVPRGTEHRPVADEEVHLVLFEPASTLNTGNVVGERTVSELPTL